MITFSPDRMKFTLCEENFCLILYARLDAMGHYVCDCVKNSHKLAITGDTEDSFNWIFNGSLFLPPKASHSIAEKFISVK